MMSSRRKNNKWAGYAIGGAVVVLLFVAAKPVYGTFGPIVAGAAAALRSFGQTITSGGAVFLSNHKLQEENRRIKEENAQLRSELTLFSAVQAQNEQLKEVLGRSDTGSSTGIVASVITRPPQAPYDVFVIDAGSNEGVHEGDIVKTEGVVVGVVKEVNPHISYASLLSMPGNTFGVRIGEVEARAEGQGGGRFIIVLPKDAEVKVGDAVTTPDMNLALVGVVQHIEEPEADAFKTLYFNLPEGISNTQYVSVVNR